MRTSTTERQRGVRRCIERWAALGPSEKQRCTPRAARRGATGFTLLEVLVAIAVLGVALISLLSLHVRNLSLIERDARVSDATLLARALMTELEIGVFPDIGRDGGDFESRWPDRYPELRWETEVVTTPIPDLREVRVRVFRAGATTDASGATADEVALTYYMRRR
jgi:general secretion pathway protein I